MLAILHSLGMFIVDFFKAAVAARSREPVPAPSSRHRLEARTGSASIGWAFAGWRQRALRR
jgi:hypothetical protein